MGAEYGVEPALSMLQMAKARGIQVVEAFGEKIPFPGRMFGVILIAFTLCFLDQPQKALEEARRVLQPDGGLVLGLILRGSPWAEFYQAKGKGGHPIFSQAHFYSKGEIEDLLKAGGFVTWDYCSTLFQPPE